MPFIDGSVELQAWVGTLPSAIANVVPKVFGLDHFVDLAILPSCEVPILIPFQGLKEVIADP